MTRKEHLDPLAVGLLLACCLFWGFQQVLVKATIAEIAPVFQSAVRFTAATGVLGLWCRWRGIALFDRDGQWRSGLLAGVLFTFEFAFLYNALVYTSASRATVFIYTSPFWVALFVPLVVKTERLRAVQWAGLLLAFLALVFAFRDGLAAPGASTAWLGDLLALGAGMAWGLTTVVIRGSGLNRLSPEKLLFYQMAVAALCLPFVSWWQGEAWVWHWSRFGWTSMVLQTFVGAFASYLAWMWLLRHYPAMRIAVFVFLTPVFALVIGAVWLHEPVSPGLVLAVVLVAAGILLVNRAGR
jgi:drug/metabolite transporter (DMT)-like permease